MKISFTTAIFLMAPLFSAAQNEIGLTYEFEMDKSDSSRVHVRAKIMNKFGNDFYFLSQSCNGLNYYLSTNSTKAVVYIMLHCNATYPEKIELKAHSELTFKTSLRIEPDLQEVALKLKLMQLTANSNLDGKYFPQIEKEDVVKTLYVRGPSRKVPYLIN